MCWYLYNNYHKENIVISNFNDLQYNHLIEKL